MLPVDEPPSRGPSRHVILAAAGSIAAGNEKFRQLNDDSRNAEIG